MNFVGARNAKEMQWSLPNADQLIDEWQIFLVNFAEVNNLQKKYMNWIEKQVHKLGTVFLSAEPLIDFLIETLDWLYANSVYIFQWTAFILMQK